MCGKASDLSYPYEQVPLPRGWIYGLRCYACASSACGRGFSLWGLWARQARRLPEAPHRPQPRTSCGALGLLLLLNREMEPIPLCGCCHGMNTEVGQEGEAGTPPICPHLIWEEEEAMRPNVPEKAQGTWCSEAAEVSMCHGQNPKGSL